MKVQWQKDGTGWNLVHVTKDSQRQIAKVERVNRSSAPFKAKINFPRGGSVDAANLMTANDGRLWVRRMIRESYPSAEFSTRREIVAA